MGWPSGVPFEEIGMNEDKYTLLKELAKDNSYWESSLSFIEGIRGRNIEGLSDKQSDWLCGISAKLERELDKRVAKEVFSE